MKGAPLVGEIELGMNQGENSWDIREKQIQGNIKKTLLLLISFYSNHC